MPAKCRAIKFLFPLNSLSHRFPSIAFTMKLLLILSRSPGFHFSRAMISHSSLLSSVPLFSCRAASSTPFLRRLRCSVVSRAATRVRSHAILLRAADSLPATPFTHPPHFTPSLARSFLTVRRTPESHKALRRIFHAVIPASRGERRHSSRRPDPAGEMARSRFETRAERNFLGLLSNAPTADR